MFEFKLKCTQNQHWEDFIYMYHYLINLKCLWLTKFHYSNIIVAFSFPFLFIWLPLLTLFTIKVRHIFLGWEDKNPTETWKKWALISKLHWLTLIPLFVWCQEIYHPVSISQNEEKNCLGYDCIGLCHNGLVKRSGGKTSELLCSEPICSVLHCMLTVYVTVHHKPPVKSAPGQFYFIADSDRIYLQLWIDNCLKFIRHPEVEFWFFEAWHVRICKTEITCLKFSFYTHFQYSYI